MNAESEHGLILAKIKMPGTYSDTWHINQCEEIDFIWLRWVFDLFNTYALAIQPLIFLFLKPGSQHHL